MSEQSFREDESGPADRELEAVLAGLRPTVGHLDPLDAMFEAGRRSARSTLGRQLLGWRAAAAIAVLALGVSIAVQAKSGREERLAQSGMTTKIGVPVDPPTPSDGEERIVIAALPPDSLLALQQRAMEERFEMPPSPRLRPLGEIRAGDFWLKP